MTWGIAAPLFLFLAGVALVLAAGARLRKGLTDAEAAALARRRGWQIFGLAFLFRLQAWLISGGDAYRTLLKVDILNVMGLAMLAGAVLWGLGRGSWSRGWLLAGAAVAAAMVTPVVRAAPWLAPLPDPLEWYLRPFAGATTFTLLPWAGFLLAGGAVGFWIDSARSPRDARVMNAGLAVVGTVIAVGGYAASFLPPIYAADELLDELADILLRASWNRDRIRTAGVSPGRGAHPAPICDTGIRTVVVICLLDSRGDGVRDLQCADSSAAAPRMGTGGMGAADGLPVWPREAEGTFRTPPGRSSWR